MAKKANKEWTVIGAARRGRDLRADTVQDMRDELATYQKTGASPTISRYFSTLSGNYTSMTTERKEGINSTLRAIHGMTGYKPRYLTNLKASEEETQAQVDEILWDLAERVISDEVSQLAETELYVLSPEMCDVVTAAAASLTRDDCDLMEAEDLPSLTGMIILPQEIRSEGATGHARVMRAVRWDRPRDFPVFDEKLRRRYYPGLRLATYSDPASAVGIRPGEEAQLPPLAFAGNQIASLAEVQEMHNISEMIRETNARALVRKLADPAIMEEIRVDYERGAVIPDPEQTFNLRFLYAFSRICAQEIAISERAPLTHRAGEQSRELDVPSDINIVQLRRQREQRESDDPHFRTSIQWKSRWVVRMHKVRQYYPSENRHRIIFRGPYVKGPEHLPIAAPRLAVTAVSR